MRSVRGDLQGADETDDDREARPPGIPGKVSLTQRMLRGPSSDDIADRIVQRLARGSSSPVEGDEAQAVAAAGFTGSAGRLPELDAIQRLFGRHDITGTRAYIGGAAAEASEVLGARAYASGDQIAFAEQPDRFLIAHELAHVVQQRNGVQLAGGVGREGDVHEQHANAVAERVVRGESAEALLDACPGGGGASGAAVQRWGERELRARQSRQDWDSATIDGRLADVDPSIEPAIRANQALGFGERNLEVLREALGLPDQPRLIERRFVQAVRRVQLGGAVIETDRSGAGADARRPAEVPSTGDGSGVLDEATIMRLDLSAAVDRRHARPAYAAPPWSRFSVEEIVEIRATLAGPLGIGEDDLTAVPRGRATRVTVSPRFLERAAAWQLWNHRADGHVVFGRLLAQELSELRVGVPLPAPRAARVATPTEEPAEGAAPEIDPLADEDGATETGPADQPIEQRLELVRAARTELRSLLGGYRRAVNSHDEAAITAARGVLTSKMAAMRDQIEPLELPRTDFSGSQTYERPNVQAQHMIRELDYILDASVGAPRTSAQERAAEAEESSPLDRRTEGEARDALRGDDLVVRDATITHRGWDSRVAGADGTTDPSVAARRGEANAAAMTALRERMVPHRDALRPITRGRRPDPAPIIAALDALAREDFAHSEGWHPPDAGRELRQAWSPGSRPDLLTAGAAAAMDAGDRLALAREWLSWLSGALGELGTGTGRGEIRRQRGYATADPTRIGHAAAVEVDLHRTGVTITNNAGNPLPTSRMRLDPQFADAFVRFVRALQGLGVSEIRTAGFLRAPISPADTHPRGQACDITGFQIGDQLLHLRSGRPMDPPPAGNPSAQAQYDSLGAGHSDWFDHTGTVGGMTHEEVMHAVTNMMRSYFSTIVGPGNDPRHMGHWHVELTGSGRTGPQVRAQMDDRDQPDFVTDRADARQPEWRTPDERVERADDEV